MTLYIPTLSLLPFLGHILAFLERDSWRLEILQQLPFF